MKKIFLVFLAAVLVCSSGCYAQGRPDISSFAEKMGNIDDKFSFDYFDMYIYEEIYHVYLSLCSEDDVMLSFETDSVGNIDSVTATACNEAFVTEECRKELSLFLSAVTECFAELSDTEKNEFREKIGIDRYDLYFTDIYESYTSLRHNFVYSSNSLYICFRCDYYECETV